MLIALLITLLESLWFFPLVFRRGKENTLPTGKIMGALLLSLIPACVFGLMGTGLVKKFLLSALKLTEGGKLYKILLPALGGGVGEEAGKLLTVLLLLRYAKPRTKLDYVLVFGAVGTGFTLWESFLYGMGGIGVILRSFTPLHIMLQFRMGGHFYEVKQARAAGDRSRVTKELLMMLVIPVFFHACNNALVTLPEVLLADISAEDVSFATTPGLICMLLFVALWVFFVFIYSVITERWAGKMVRATRVAGEAVEEA